MFNKIRKNIFKFRKLIMLCIIAVLLFNINNIAVISLSDFFRTEKKTSEKIVENYKEVSDTDVVVKDNLEGKLEDIKYKYSIYKAVFNTDDELDEALKTIDLELSKNKATIYGNELMFNSVNEQLDALSSSVVSMFLANKIALEDGNFLTIDLYITEQDEEKDYIFYGEDEFNTYKINLKDKDDLLELISVDNTYTFFYNEILFKDSIGNFIPYYAESR